MSTKVNNELQIANAVSQESQTLSYEDKQEIIDVIKESIKIYKSAAKVANKCQVSDATISLMLKNGYLTKGEDMWRKVAAALNWSKNGWNIVDTTNVKIVTKVLTDAQTESMFIPISEKAGSSKSAGITKFLAEDNTKNVFRLTCRDWNRREFLVRLRITLGLNLVVGTVTLDDMLQQIIHFLKMRKGKPLLILDQANSLKPSIFSYLIHIYNELEDQCGLVMVGTENLEKEIKRGVQLGRKSYDEIDSRLGRNYIHLVGNTKNDVRKICEGNGISSSELITTIWHECSPTHKTINTGDQQTQVNVVEDGRRIKRSIRKHLMLTAMKNAAEPTLQIAQTA